MLDYELRYDDAILVLTPAGALEARDFRALAPHVDADLAAHGTLRGVMLQAREFPGWKDFDALVAHLKFVRLHHRKIEKIAVVSDSDFAMVIPHLASLFLRAKIKHFDLTQTDAALSWLSARGHARMRTAA